MSALELLALTHARDLSRPPRRALGQHVEGIVDAYYCPPELADAVDAEPPVDPRSLVSAAELLLDELQPKPEVALHDGRGH